MTLPGDLTSAPTTNESGASVSKGLAERRRLALVATGILIATYGLAIPKQPRHQIDHQGLLNTLTRMRGGAGYYDAFRETYRADIGVTLGGPRSFRTPWLALFLRPIPPSLYYLLFLVLVVGLTSWFFMRSTRNPWVGLPVTLYLLMAGRMPPLGGAVEGWLLVELWTIPFLAACYHAYRRKHWWTASMAAVGATLIRELAFPVLFMGLLLARRRGEPQKPWLVGMAMATAGWALHISLAFGYGSKHGTEATLWGTGSPPGSVLAMMTFAIVAPAMVGVALWALAVLRNTRSEAFAASPLTVLLFVPLAGVFFDRPYWGLIAIPFVIFSAAESLAELVELAADRLKSRRRSFL